MELLDHEGVERRNGKVSAGSISAVWQTVILAAGNGIRMHSPHSLPKPLLPVAGRPLLAHTLEQAEAAGCREAVVIVGYGASAVRDFLQNFDTGLRLQTIDNPEYLRPNGLSLLRAEAYAAPRFFLQMADHVFADEVLARLAVPDAAPAEYARVLVDRSTGRRDIEEATRVRLHGRRVVAIGKGVERWDAVDAGCFLLDRRIFPALRRAAKIEEPSVSAGMRQLAAGGVLAAADLGSIPWVDVDTPDEHRAAERLMAQTLAAR